MAHVNPIQIQKFLKGVDYPASKQALIDNAKNMGADENVCASLEQLPDEDFQTPADVSQAFGAMSDDAGEQEKDSSATHDRRGSSAGQSGGNEFVAQAVEDSMAEVELCELALQRSASDEVKSFAQQMIDEHSRMGTQLETLARDKKIDLPKDLESKHKAAQRQMEKLSGTEFDRAFMQHNVKEHENDIKVFRHYAEQESDDAICKLAENGVQMLEKHLQMARDIEQRLSS
ncbi:DUF4142 domain-containing protein [Noviherbaspirillum sp. ST9]|uniref:DUF4142 domain-containing protein n=1 Tax=Noviherbaspirillum sp. ST9 TaxID=3401606 RepID=UPI003B58AED7